MRKVFILSSLIGLALIAASDRASAQIGVAVYVNNSTAAKVKGVFQSTDAGDLGTNCTATSGTGSSQCNNSKNYNNPPKNIKNLLCISSKVSIQPTQQCGALLTASGCKKNNIFTSLCGAGFGKNVVPTCIYRTGVSGFASWTWTVSPVANSTAMNLDCAISGYTGVTTN